MSHEPKRPECPERWRVLVEFSRAACRRVYRVQRRGLFGWWWTQRTFNRSDEAEALAKACNWEDVPSFRWYP